MKREESERIAYTIWRTCTKCRYTDVDFINSIADDVEHVGHLLALKIWEERLAPLRCIAGKGGVTVIFG